MTNLIHCGEMSHLSKAKIINLWGMESYAFAMSNHIVAKVDLWVLASFRACQTMERCSQQPGTFSIQPFWIELLMNLLLYIKWISRRLEIRLKKSFPSTFKRAIGRKSESLVSDGVLTLGIYIFWALRHCIGISHLLKQAWKILKRNWLVFGYFL